MRTEAQLFEAVERGDYDVVCSLVTETPSLVHARDATGATPLHVAAFHGHREIVELLHRNGADINARDSTHHATPAGWAIHYLRERGALLAIEIEDVLFAIQRGDATWVERLVTRHPALLDAVDRNGRSLTAHAMASEDARIVQVFERR